MRLSLLCAAVAVASGCGTPCNAPGGLCAPISSITSPPPPAEPLPLPKPPPEPTPPEAETFAVTLPGASPQAPGSGLDASAAPLVPRSSAMADANGRALDDAMPAPSNQPIRMALLLPLRSETLGAAAESLRAGFMAAWERDRDNIIVSVIETGDVPQDVLSSYANALQRQDMVVGPLARSAVAVVANSVLVTKPTIALNYPDGYGGPDAAPLPPLMLAMGLSIEEEARQVAQWAAADHPNSGALVLTTATPWQRRVTAAFAGQWQRMGMAVRTVELSAPNGYLNDPELAQLRARLRDDTPGLLFSAMGADQTRQLRGALQGSASDASDASNTPVNPIFSTADAMPPPPPEPKPAASPFAALPIYGTSALNAGSGDGKVDASGDGAEAGAGLSAQGLDGVRLLDLPWQVQRDHPAVMVYPHRAQAGGADMERLYALGIDAYRVAREIGRHGPGRFQLDGVTGRLTVDFGRGAASFERVEQSAVVQNGAPLPVIPATAATPSPQH